MGMLMCRACLSASTPVHVIGREQEEVMSCECFDVRTALGTDALSIDPRVDSVDS